MVADVGQDQHQGMNGDHSTTQDQQALKAGAHALQQAAGKVLRHAGAAEDPRTLGVALAHIEEALDRLSVAMLQAAHVVTSGQEAAADGRHPTPSAEALCFHLRRTAERLHEPQLACESSRFWTRRMIASESHDEAARVPAYEYRVVPVAPSVRDEDCRDDWREVTS